MQDLHSGWAENVIEAMYEQRINRRQLADGCGVHPSTITRILTGKLCPNDELKWKIAGVLHVRMDRLWAWPQIVPPAPSEAAA